MTELKRYKIDQESGEVAPESKTLLGYNMKSIRDFLKKKKKSDEVPEEEPKKKKNVNALRQMFMPRDQQLKEILRGIDEQGK